MATTYEELREKLRARPGTAVQVPYDFSNINIQSLSAMPPNQFVATVVKALTQAYQENPAFQKVVDEDYAKAKDSVYRLVYNWLESIENQIQNPEMISKLRSTGPVAKTIVSELNKTLSQIKREQELSLRKSPPKAIEPLSVAELEEFEIDGLIDPKITDEQVREAIRSYQSQTTDSRDTQDKKVQRFKRTVEIARERSERPQAGDVLTDEEAEKYFSNDKGYGIKSVSEITPDLTEDQMDLLMQNLVKSRKKSRRDLDKESKRDLLNKLVNTVLRIKEDAYANPDKYPSISQKIKSDLAAREKGTKARELFIDKLRNPDYIKKMIEHVVYPRSRVEMQRDDLGELQTLTEEEREEFNELDKMRQRLKVDDPARALTVAHQMLIGLRNFEDRLKKMDYGTVLDRTLGRVVDTLPGISDIEEYLDVIEQQLSSMGVSKADISTLIPDKNGQLDRDVIKNKMLETQKELKNLLSRREKEKLPTKVEQIERDIKNKQTEIRRLLRLNKIPKKALYDSVDSYFTYLDNKESELKNLETELRKEIAALSEVLEGVLDMTNFFRDLSRQKEYRSRWQLPGAITEQEKEKAKERNLEQDMGGPVSKIAVDLNSYESFYRKIRDGLSDAEAALTDLEKILQGIKLKTLSIVEASPEKSDLSQMYRQKAMETENPEEKQKLLSLAEKTRTLFEDLGLTQDLRNNPYGGQGPKVEEVVDALKGVVSDLNKIDVRKKIDQARSTIDSLRNISRWVKPGKAKESSQGFFIADILRKVASSLVESARARRTAPSNIPQGPDIGFYRTRGDKKIPNFLIQDSTGMVKKLIEHLQKNWEDYTSGDQKKAGDAIDDAIQKVLKTKGSLEDWMGNYVQRKADATRGIATAQEDVRKISERQQEAAKEFEGLKEKYVPAMERLIDFIERPLTRISEAIKRERGELPGRKQKRQERVEAAKTSLKDLINKAGDIKGPLGITLLEKLQGKTGVRPEGIEQIKDITLPRPDPLMIERLRTSGSKRLKPISREEAESAFISKFNRAFSRVIDVPFTRIPTNEDILKIADRMNTKVRREKSAFRMYRRFELLDRGLPLGNKKTAEDIIYKDVISEDRSFWQSELLSYLSESAGNNEGLFRFEHKLPKQAARVEKQDQEAVGEYDAFVRLFNETFHTDFSGSELPSVTDITEMILNWVNDEQSYLEAYNEATGQDKEELPTLDEMREISNNLGKQRSRQPMNEKENLWLEEYKKATGVETDKIPTINDIKSHITALIRGDTTEEDQRAVNVKEKAVKFLEDMPKNMEQAIQKVPASVADKQWFKEIQRDRSHHKTRWIDRIFSRMDEPSQEPEDFTKHLKALSNDVAIALQDIRKASELDTLAQTVRKNLNDAFQAIISAVNTNDPLGEILNINNFRQRVFYPAKELARQVDEFRNLMAVAIPLIVEYRQMNAAFEVSKGKISEVELEGLSGTEKKEKRQELQEKYENIRKHQKAILNKTGALISAFTNNLEEITNKLQLVKNEIVPLFQDALAQFNDSDYKQYVSRLYDKTVAADVEKMIREIYDIYKKTIAKGERAVQKGEKEKIKIAARARPGGGGDDKSPYDIALDTRPGREDVGPIKDRAQVYNQIEKTVQYVKRIVEKLEDLKVTEAPDTVEEVADSMEFINSFGSDAADLVGSLRNQVLPGLKNILTQQVEIMGPEGERIVTNLESATQDLDDMMHEYTERRVKLLNRLGDLVRQREEKMDALRDWEGFIDPETGEYTGMSDKEKKILTRFFLRLLYRYLDELWAKMPGRQFAVTGEREDPNYYNVWKRFQNIAGPKSNRQLMSILSAIKADIRPDERDSSKKIRFKGDELQAKYDRLAKRFKEMDQDPEDSEEMRDLKKMIKWLKEKEKAVDKVFAHMRRTSDLDYLAEIKNALREKSQSIGPVEDEAKFVAIPVEKEIKQEAAKNAESIDTVINRAQQLVGKETPLKLETTKGQMVAEEPSIDKIQQTSEALLDELDKALKGLGLETGKESSYRTDKNFDPRFLYGSVMRRTIKKLLERDPV